MKLTLNLLPEDRKKEINNNKRFVVAVRQSLLFLLPLICLLAVLITINFILEINLKVQNESFAMEQNQGQYKKLKEYEDNFARVNSKIGILTKIESSHYYWRNVFEKLNLMLPENVYLTGFASKDYLISISGRAKIREDFLKFRDNISSSDCFENINTPLSNLVEKSDVDFQIDFEVKESCLRSI